jgi:hypothetical protein
MKNHCCFFFLIIIFVPQVLLFRHSDAISSEKQLLNSFSIIFLSQALENNKNVIALSATISLPIFLEIALPRPSTGLLPFKTAPVAPRFSSTHMGPSFMKTDKVYHRTYGQQLTQPPCFPLRV